ncbi:tail fiber domain-containing protein [Fulvivirgaceae bacterium BMA12]|uniref:Tail fiber domain-containing protein n=1 Tax=Agaribacillus aureus TaxID=3051825 RepID=A0ABT8LHP2_9BACT|nr:tail fiber domain-containing protein [Fulvivirgaceae bacterium BMA12]
MRLKVSITFFLLAIMTAANAQRNTNYGGSAGFSGSDNVSVGYWAGNWITGATNTFVGTKSGSKAGNSGNFNSFFGYNSGYNNTSGDNNVFLGSASGESNTSGFNNTFVGVWSGATNTTGWHNTCLGLNAGSYNVSGNLNTYVGSGAGISNNGSNNVFLGSQSGHRAQNSSGNVFIGNRAGYYETQSNKLYIANNSTTIPLIYGDFTTGRIGLGSRNLTGFYRLYISGSAFATGLWLSSDKRFKTNGKDIQGALDKIKSIKGRSFEYKKSKKLEARAFNEGEQLGFYAQELQKVFPELVQEDNEGFLAVNYIGLIPVLVEAVKELQVSDENAAAYDSKITALESRIVLLEQLMKKEGLGVSGNQGLDESMQLFQNIPNPANSETRIQYKVSNEAQHVSLLIYDLSGKQLKSFPNLSPGKGEVILSAFEMEAGTYLYSLLVDGKVTDTKRMILTK